VEQTGAGLATVGAEAVRQIDQTATGTNTPSSSEAAPQVQESQRGTAGPSTTNAPRTSTPQQGAPDRARVSEAEARRAADKAADVLASASIWSFFALVGGAIAACFGGTLGRPPLVEVERATVG
jgi:hypothetical protein